MSSMVRGPMMVQVTAGWRRTKAMASSIKADPGLVSQIGELFGGFQLALVLWQ